MPPVCDQVDLARRFADALDRCDYLAAGEFLADDCRYHVSGDDVRVGPAAILNSYQQSDRQARREFDPVEYSSVAVADDPDWVQLNFVDELHCRGRTHTFRCIQKVHFAKSGKIDRIELHELPGERERRDEFRKTTAAPSM